MEKLNITFAKHVERLTGLELGYRAILRHDGRRFELGRICRDGKAWKFMPNNGAAKTKDRVLASWDDYRAKLRARGRKVS